MRETRSYRPLAIGWMLCVTGILSGLGGCQTSKSPDIEKKTATGKRLPSGKITFVHDTLPLGDVVRQLGENVGGRLALMAGLEEYPVRGAEHRNQAFGEIAAYLAASAQAQAMELSQGWFICPPGYDVLTQIKIADRLPDRYAGITATVAFGAKTPLYNVFSVMSENLGINIVADNYLTEARCGELFLENAPLADVLELILMSARIPPAELVVEATDEYILFASARNPHNDPPLLNPEAAEDPAVSAILERVVPLVVLPSPGANPLEVAFGGRPDPLREVLTPLSRQLGIPVAAYRSMGDIPITPCLLRNVRVKTVIELVLRQWPVDTFGYEVSPDRILLRPR
ncbi:MAG TPA: hypothetical protein PK379_05605 [Candidatus Hydrogenedentes bacterium]|nr:hypothetical protein [Candidatus Hydrogenedentota bacterium]HOK89481.1 hypothetical protein [Candidatus Hydrogenedentota bacterium]